jgi:sporulation protein YlmC with PRC-barrel domain
MVTATAGLATAVLIAIAPQPASSQETTLVVVDVKKVATGYRVSELTGDDVVNDKKETIGDIDDFVVARDKQAVFAVIEVGDFLELGRHLVAVPFESLKMDSTADEIVLPGATREALKILPMFEYGG